ncbi:unnamed protein product [Cyprideis torosa]|uniref:Protein HIRA n=1 Tax=Cyprideis torosa TaxID=163714 RepID=A0A7R8ZNA4_9CRUS|nr:unnamed protein product [Cyprideis torosa]CAG0897568.1 unnamed protein product [Cyprideis torosa]
MSPTSIDAPAEEPSVITNIVKPGWVKHGKRRIPIFSIDIHPDLSRFATGGQGDDGGLVLLWAMAAVYSEKNQRNPNVPKLLSRLENHSGCVNCVRWSPSGKALASGGDDKLVMIWRQSKSSFGSSGGGNTGFGGSEAVENWRVVATLRSHSEDVLGLAWSPLENQLASCSVDNTIVVWDATKWNQIITVLKGHSGLVKGVTYDPIGKFLASQGDDKTLRIWRTSDWACTATQTTGSTHVLRLDWSPDGNFIVSAHAMNGQAPVAKIVERNTWNCEKDFVGHRKAVCCVRFCPSLCYSRTGGKVMSLLAMGSRDKSISVWFTTSLRPVLVLEDVFQDSVLDISWSPNGRFLAACSADGSVVFLEFDQKLLGVALTNNDKEKLFKRLYGSVPTLSTTASTNQQAVVEDAALLTLATTDQNSHDKLTPEKPKPMANGSDAVFLSPQKAPLPVETSVPSGPSPAKPQQTITKQIETRTKEGKRRIQPIFIPPDDNNDEAPAPFIPEGAEDISMSSFTLERATSPSPTIEAKRKLEENTTAGPAKEKENHDTPVIKSTEDGGPPCSKKPRALLAGMGPLPDKEVLEKAVEETKVLGSNRVSSTVSSVSEGHLPQSDKPPVPVVMPLPAPQESGATISSTTAKESSSTASSVPPVKKQARLGVDYFPSHPLMTSKSSSKKISSAGTPAAALQATGSVASASVSSVVPTGLPQVSAAVEALGIEVLPKMQFKGSCSVRLAPSPSSQMLPLLIQAQNGAFSCAQTSVSLLRVSKDRSLTVADSSGLSSVEEESSSEVIWEQVFGTDLIGLVASEKVHG